MSPSSSAKADSYSPPVAPAHAENRNQPNAKTTEFLLLSGPARRDRQASARHGTFETGQRGRRFSPQAGQSSATGKPERLQERCPIEFSGCQGSVPWAGRPVIFGKSKNDAASECRDRKRHVSLGHKGRCPIRVFPFFSSGLMRFLRRHETRKAGKARISKSCIHWKHLTFYNSIGYPMSHNGSGSACLYGWTDSCDVGEAIGTESARPHGSRRGDGLGAAADGD